MRALPLVAESWQRDPILSQLLIKQMVTDKAGYRWIASDIGVLRYDGYELVPLRKLLRPGTRPAPERQALSLTLDHGGYLWMGTQSGLYRFNPRTGDVLSVSLPNLRPALGIGVITLFCHPVSGQLWVGYDAHNVAVLDPQHPQRPVAPPRRLRSGAYFFQTDGSADGVWVSLRQVNWPVQQFYSDSLQPGVAHLRPTGMPEQTLGTRCFMVPIPGTAPLRLFSASALFEATPDGRLRELQRWLPEGNEDNFRLQIPSPTDSVREWASQGYRLRLLVRGPHAGQIQRDTLRFDDGPLDHRHSFVLEQDPLGIQWCYSQFWRGAYKQPASRRPVAEPQRLASGRPTPSTRGILRLPDGRLLLGAYGGPLTQAADSPTAPLRPLRVYENGRPRLPLGYDLLRTRANQVLWTEEFRGFSLFDYRTNTLQSLRYATPDVPAHGRAQCLFEDHTGQVWGGTETGLYRLDPTRLLARRYAPTQPGQHLPPLEILDIAEDVGTRSLWLATTTGVYLLTPATGWFERVGDSLAPRPLPTNKALCIASAGPGRAWVGTMADGLLLVDRRAGLVQQLGLAEGLPSNAVCTVLRRPDGSVWAGTFAGLVHYSPQAQSLAVFGTADGLANPEFNRNSAYAEPGSDVVWFGGVGGLHRIRTSAAQGAAPRSAGRLLLTAIGEAGGGSDSTSSIKPLLTNQHLPTLHLSAEPSAFVELRLALSDLNLPALTHYAYRLRRTSTPTFSAWLPTTRRLMLRSLPAGDYEVEVRAETASGRIAGNTIRVRLHAARVWWQHPVAWALGAALLVALGYLLFWLQGRRARREARLREELAANLHDEVGTLLTKISLMAEMLQQPNALVRTADSGADSHADSSENSPADSRAVVTAPGVVSPPRQLASQLTSGLLANSRAAAEAMRDVVWSIDSRADSVAALLDRMHDYLDQLAGSAGPAYEFTADPLARLQSLRPVVRKHIYLIFKEAVANSLRHGKGATLLQVRLVREGNAFLLEVLDDGHAAAATGRSGQGLRNMATRAKTLGGTLEAGPRADGKEGFSVRLRVRG